MRYNYNKIVRIKNKMSQQRDLTVTGYNLFDYADNEITGDNCDYIYTPITRVGHELVVRDQNGTYHSMKLKIIHGECGSGYCTATIGELILTEVSAGYTETLQYIPISPISIPMSVLDTPDDETYIETKCFTFSVNGGDIFYPSGGYTVNQSLFKKK